MRGSAIADAEFGLILHEGFLALALIGKHGAMLGETPNVALVMTLFSDVPQVLCALAGAVLFGGFTSIRHWAAFRAMIQEVMGAFAPPSVASRD